MVIIVSDVQSPLISVIIPAWNVEATLVETLASLQGQTYTRWEALIVDDGSTDGTADVARRFVEMDPRIKFSRQANAGAPAARNTALRQAQGDWIALLDADDVWLPTKLSSQIELLRSDSRANLLYTNYWVWDGQRDLSVRYSNRKKLPDGDKAKYLYYWNLFGASTVVVKRDLVIAAGGFDPELAPAEDWDLWLRIAETRLWSRGVWEPQVRYRRWSGNVSNKKVQMGRAAESMLEKALARPQPPERARHYRRSLQLARAHSEFIKAQPLIATSPRSVPAAIFRAWCLYPPRLKWLLWYLATAWPYSLGGRFTAGIIHRKMLQKW